MKPIPYVLAVLAILSVVGFSVANSKLSTAAASTPGPNPVPLKAQSQAPGAQLCVPAPAGLVSWWPAEGNANDIWGTNNGTLQNGARFAPGMVGTAFSFDGIDANVFIADSPSLNPTEITIDAWVYPTAYPSFGAHIVSKDGTSDDPSMRQYILNFFYTHLPYSDIWTSEGRYFETFATTPLQLRTWYHLAMTYDGSVSRFYVNGTLEGSTTASGSIVTTKAPLYIGLGILLNGYVNAFQGRVDEVDIFNRALNDTEIQAIYNAGSAGKCPPVTLSTSNLTFGLQLVHTRSAARAVTLTNNSGAVVNVTSITSIGDFPVTNNCGSSVAAGASCTIEVAFNPAQKNSRRGVVTITDDAGNNPQTIALTGTGTVVQLLPASVNFGSEPVGMTSAPQTITVTNVGSDVLNITAIGISGTNIGDFAETKTCGSTLAGGASCTVSVTFTPTATGARDAYLVIADNGGGGKQRVHLTGTGI